VTVGAGKGAGAGLLQSFAVRPRFWVSPAPPVGGGGFIAIFCCAAKISGEPAPTVGGGGGGFIAIFCCAAKI
jgi:hypothetical protein